MKNKILFLILCLFCFCNVSASTLMVTTELNFRSSATTGSSKIGVLSVGEELELIEEASSGNGCSDKWYKVKYKDKVGYVCSTYVVKYLEPVPVEPDLTCSIIGETTSVVEVCNDETCSMVETKSVIETCSVIEEKIEPIVYTEEILRGMGFSDGYINELLALNKKYPYWRFEAYKTNYSFDSIVKAEHTKDGRSLLQDTAHSRDGLKSTATWSYNYKTDKFSTNFYGGGSTWYAASEDTIAYYLDPRNFLDEKHVFMFETLSYNPEIHTLAGIKNMLKGSFMDGKMADETHSTAQAFLDAAKTYNVSPYLLISRVIQEVGKGGSTIVSGTVSGYEGYYNFYNINAAGNSNTETINNGLKHAKEKGWNTWYKAIVGGGSFLASNYITKGQDTLYFEKWDLVGTVGDHQYMQNIEAPSSEVIRTYNSYNTLGLLNSAFVFKIPVYNNMKDEYRFPSTGNPNNYLSSLQVDSQVLFNDSSDKTEFELTYYKSVKTITIAAKTIRSGATISNIGVINLNDDDKQTINVTVTAQNGAKRIYKINITKINDPHSESVDVNSVEKIEDLIGNDKYLSVKTNTKMEDVINKFKNINSNISVIIKDKNGDLKEEGILVTGDIINIKYEDESKELTLIIYGDINQDGLIDSADLLVMRQYLLGQKNLEGASKIAATLVNGSTIDSADLLKLKQYLLGQCDLG